MIRSALTRLIRLYQAFSAARPPSCRFWPSCSTYAIEALENHGAARGMGLALRRLAQCHPWGRSGVDPVPVSLGAADGARRNTARSGSA